MKEPTLKRAPTLKQDSACLKTQLADRMQSIQLELI
jgi:hypothetical protein